MVALGGEEGKLLLILDLGTNGSEWHPSTHWIGGWVDPRAGVDAEARRKVLYPCQGSNPVHVVRQYSELPQLVYLFHIRQYLQDALPATCTYFCHPMK
jgi:hypothetical protein